MLSAVKIDIELPNFSLEVVFGLQTFVIVLLGGSNAPASTWYFHNIDNNSCVDSKNRKFWAVVTGHLDMGGRFSLMSVSVVTPLRCVKKEECLLNILRCKNKKNAAMCTITAGTSSCLSFRL